MLTSPWIVDRGLLAFRLWADRPQPLL